MTWQLAALAVVFLTLTAFYCVYVGLAGNFSSEKVSDPLMFVVGIIAMLLAGLTVPEVGRLRDEERLPLVRSAYPGLPVAHVINTGKVVTFFADSSHQLECEGSLSVDELEVTITYEAGPRAACEEALEKALARAEKAEDSR